MEYKLFDRSDVELMMEFVDDRNTKYEEEKLLAFLEDDKTYGFVAKKDNRIIGFAFGYSILKPDGNTDFYLHAIDVIPEYQNQGYGTELMNYINEYTKEIGCRKMFLVTNKSNVSACRCYEKSGGLTKADDDIVYVY